MPVQYSMRQYLHHALCHAFVVHDVIHCDTVEQIYTTKLIHEPNELNLSQFLPPLYLPQIKFYHLDSAKVGVQ